MSRAQRDLRKLTERRAITNRPTKTVRRVASLSPRPTREQIHQWVATKRLRVIHANGVLKVGRDPADIRSKVKAKADSAATGVATTTNKASRSRDRVATRKVAARRIAKVATLREVRAGIQQVARILKGDMPRGRLNEAVRHGAIKPIKPEIRIHRKTISRSPITMTTTSTAVVVDS